MIANRDLDDSMNEPWCEACLICEGEESSAGVVARYAGSAASRSFNSLPRRASPILLIDIVFDR